MRFETQTMLARRRVRSSTSEFARTMLFFLLVLLLCFFCRCSVALLAQLSGYSSLGDSIVASNDCIRANREFTPAIPFCLAL